MQTRVVRLAIRRAAETSCERERKNGRPERMSATSRSGGASTPAAAGSGIRPLPRCGVLIATGLVWQSPECEVRRLLLAHGGEEAGLPAAEPALVAKQEPEHHRDPRVRARHLVGLRQVLGLLGPGDAEEPVGRTRLVAVLGDPELLVPVETGQEPGQLVDVRERDDSALRLRLGRRRLAGIAGVRVV